MSAGPVEPVARSYYWCEHAWLTDGVAASVRVAVGGDGRIASVTSDTAAEPGDERLAGVVLPGFANAHSHAFHRALRGRTHSAGGTFWTWREGMYAVAAQLDPDSYLALARATYAEMALAGVTTVGEFHYLHHGPGGVRYDDPNAMGEALRQAAADAGIRLTLLDTCYLRGGLTAAGHTVLEGPQLRFGDDDVQAWAERVGKLAGDAGTRIGVAAHSVRAVPAADLPTVVAVSEARSPSAGPVAAPRHVHLSEQPAENSACLAYYGRTPAALLSEHGFLGRAASVVHATHLTEEDVELLGGTRTTACFCPTTERDLADGIGPARALHDGGAVLSLGSDQHAVIDLLEEARGLEMHERLDSLQRGRFRPDALVRALTADGQASLGWPDAGRIEPGARADLVAVRLDSVRTAGSSPGQVVFAATAADVTDVIVDGRRVVAEGHHVLGDIGRLLDAAIAPLWPA